MAQILTKSLAMLLCQLQVLLLPNAPMPLASTCSVATRTCHVLSSANLEARYTKGDHCHVYRFAVSRQHDLDGGILVEKAMLRAQRSEMCLTCSVVSDVVTDQVLAHTL